MNHAGILAFCFHKFYHLKGGAGFKSNWTSVHVDLKELGVQIK